MSKQSNHVGNGADGAVHDRGLDPATNRECIVLGAGPCGLAVARQLRHEHGVEALTVDRAPAPAWSWRQRYDGFRLNTCGWWSHLPGQRIPLRHGRWPDRQAMVEYFDDYASRQGIELRLGWDVSRIERIDDGWRLNGPDGESMSTSALVVATGNYRKPATPPWPGLESYGGRVVHSADYRNPWPFEGEDVLVVGTGNSAADIAVQLSQHGQRKVWLAVRTPPHVVRRSTFGVPADSFGTVAAKWRVDTVDRIGRVVRKASFGDLSAYGFDEPPLGVYTTMLTKGRIPTLVDDLLRQIKKGLVDVVPAVESFTPTQVLLADGGAVEPDAVVAATGFKRGLSELFDDGDIFDARDEPHGLNATPAADGLWFAGYAEPLEGPLRYIRLHAGPVAAAVAGHLSRRPAGARELAHA
jgi:cation diffusion facilitator CzcD-associated flavoprotein CzcO